jgi:hypothetical protein
MNKTNFEKEIQRCISSGLFTKVCRFFLDVLSSTPWIGGAFGAIAAAWSEAEQKKINVILTAWSKLHDDKIDKLEKLLILSGQPEKWVASYIKFNPNTAKLIETSKVIALTDNGMLDFTIHFKKPYRSQDYTFQYFGSGEVRLSVIEQTEYDIRIKFQEPCPNIVTLAFIKI